MLSYAHDHEALGPQGRKLKESTGLAPLGPSALCLSRGPPLVADEQERVTRRYPGKLGGQLSLGIQFTDACVTFSAPATFTWRAIGKPT